MAWEGLLPKWPTLLERAGLPADLVAAWQGTRLAGVVVERSTGCLRLEVEGELEEGVVRQTEALLVAALPGAGVKVSLLPGCTGEVAVAAESAVERPDHLDESEYLRQVLAQREEEVPAAGDRGGGRSRTIVGRAIRGEALPLPAIEEGLSRAVIRGEVASAESRTLKNGGRLFTFDVTDHSDTLTVKLLGEELPKDLGERIKPGGWVKVRGNLQVDRYSGELVLIASDVQEEPAPELLDGAGEAGSRVELHLHTKMSAMDSVVEVAEAINLAAALGHEAVAITDHGVVQAFPDAYEAGEATKIKIIYGLEGYLIDSDEGAEARRERERPFHFLALAADEEGLENLYRLVSESHLHHFHRHPRLPRATVARHRKGLLLGSGCESGELFRAVLDGRPTDELERLARFYDFLEIQPVGNNAFLIREGKVKDDAGLRDLNRRIYELGRRLALPVVATGDVHFVRPSDALLRQILLHGQGYEDADRQPPLHFHTTAEMLAEFSYLGEEAAREVVCANPRALAARVARLRPVPKTFHGPKIEGAAEEIRGTAESEARRRYGDPLPELVAARLDKELTSITTHGFSELYLIAARLVKKSLAEGFLVGSRGSVGSSLAATLNGITEVNPLAPHYLCPECKYSEFVTDGSVGSGADLPDKPCPRCGAGMTKDGHDIPFETFLGFEGDKVPDIDLNFAGEYQPAAHRYTEELLGAKNVFRAGTIATLADRTAYGFVRKFLDEHGRRARSAEVNRLVRGLTGVKRTTGQHPGGVMVVPAGVEIHRFTPLQYPANDAQAGTITTHFDYKAISSRLVKLDILGHDDPSVIRMLQDVTGFDPRQVALDEPSTLAIFSSLAPLGLDPADLGTTVGTLGIPEFGTRFVRQMLEATRPRTFSDLVRISGLSHGVDVWLNNAADLISAGTCTIANVIATRDDIMSYLIHRGLPAKAAFGIMEHVRKGKGLSDDEAKLMREHGVPDWFIASCGKINYLFPKAHAVAYVTMAFRIAWFKVHYPAAFYATYFTVRADEFDLAFLDGGAAGVKARREELERKGNEATARERSVVTILELIQEALLRGLNFAPADLYASDAQRFLIVEEGSLRPPLVSLAGLGAAAAQSICEARAQGPFTSVEDLRSRTRLSRAVIEVLRSYGTLAGLPETDQMSLF